MYTNSMAQGGLYHTVLLFSTDRRREGWTNLLIEAPTTELRSIQEELVLNQTGSVYILI